MIMSVNVLYKAAATANGGRDGQAKLSDGSMEVTMSTPKELGGNGKPGNNPEQLFAMGYAACFIGAMKAAAKGGPKIPENVSVTATVGIGPRSEGGFGLDIDLDISLPGMSREEAQAVVDKAHQICPYSNATRGNVEVRSHIA
jgi:Ohr subfamily peroxiredoxin